MGKDVERYLKPAKRHRGGFVDKAVQETARRLQTTPTHKVDGATEPFTLEDAMWRVAEQYSEKDPAKVVGKVFSEYMDIPLKLFANLNTILVDDPRLYAEYMMRNILEIQIEERKTKEFDNLIQERYKQWDEFSKQRRSRY